MVFLFLWYHWVLECAPQWTKFNMAMTLHMATDWTVQNEWEILQNDSTSAFYPCSQSWASIGGMVPVDFCERPMSQRTANGPFGCKPSWVHPVPRWRHFCCAKMPVRISFHPQRQDGLPAFCGWLFSSCLEKGFDRFICCDYFDRFIYARDQKSQVICTIHLRGPSKTARKPAVLR